jgi:hypothetical protein
MSTIEVAKTSEQQSLTEMVNQQLEDDIASAHDWLGENDISIESLSARPRKTAAGTLTSMSVLAGAITLDLVFDETGEKWQFNGRGIGTGGGAYEAKGVYKGPIPKDHERWNFHGGADAGAVGICIYRFNPVFGPYAGFVGAAAGGNVGDMSGSGHWVKG